MTRPPTISTGPKPPATSPRSETTAALKAEAQRLGFEAVGIAEAALNPTVSAALDRFLADGRQGDMAWMADTAERRRDPRALWPEAKSALVVGLGYGPSHDPLDDLKRPARGTISVYARGADYHDVLKRRLKQLGRWTADRFCCQVKVFVDTAPLMEKPLAAAAGLGWQGKHTNLVAPEGGSWLFLGVMLTDLDLDVDSRGEDRCGSCRRCLDICPTDAFPAPYELDARRCISYLTIEHKGPIPEEFRRAMGNRIYGCDDCLAVCPWNKFAWRAREAAFHPRAELTAPRLADLAALDEAGFRQVFAGSPIKRSGRRRLLRNVAIALGNCAEAGPATAARARPAVLQLLKDPEPLVRGAAVWALGRLDPRDAARRRPHALETETEPDVRAEWAALPEPSPAQ